MADGLTTGTERYHRGIFIPTACAVSTLESSGYGHELESSVALAGILGKLPDPLVAKWGEKTNQLLPTIPNLRHLDSWLESKKKL